MLPNSSINQNEINKFTKTAEEWWDKEGEFKMLHQINPLRLNFIYDKIANHFNLPSHDLSAKPVKVIDIGSGGGLTCIPLAERGANVTALDANKTNIDSLKTYTKNNNLKINLVNNSVEDYLKAEIRELFDVVLCLEVIEHVENQTAFIKNLARMVKPDGLIIISTINRTIKAKVQAIFLAEYILGWIRPNTHSYDKFIKPSEIQKALQGTGLAISELIGLKFSPLGNYWFLTSDDIDVNYFACIKKLTKVENKSVYTRKS